MGPLLVLTSGILVTRLGKGQVLSVLKRDHVDPTVWTRGAGA